MSPPPITTTFLSFASKVPLSKLSTLSPNPFLFDVVKNSIAGNMLFKSLPLISISLGLYTPVAIRIASWDFFNSSKVASFPTSKFNLNLIPPSFKSLILLSTTSFSSLKLGIP